VRDEPRDPRDVQRLLHDLAQAAAFDQLEHHHLLAI